MTAISTIGFFHFLLSSLTDPSQPPLAPKIRRLLLLSIIISLSIIERQIHIRNERLDEWQTPELLIRIGPGKDSKITNGNCGLRRYIMTRSYVFCGQTH